MSNAKFQELLEEGIRLVRTADYENAIPKLKPIVDRDKENIEAAYYLAIAYSNCKEIEKALEIFDSIMDKLDNPLRITQAHLIVGYIYSLKEMYELAELEFTQAEKLGIVNAQVYSALGYIFFKRKDYNRAIEHLKKAISIEPENANAHNSLGYVMLEAEMDVDEAIREIRVAVEQDSENPAYLDSLGWAYYKKGDSVNAKRYLMKAFEGAPFENEIKEHLRNAKYMQA